jgi:branched-chain amino acid transport system substrate-binding protein
MKITRRKFNIGVAAAAGTPMFIPAAPAIAQIEPIRIGWLAAMTGASSAPAIGFDRGVHYAADLINAAGGVKGRKIEILTRDTQGDPTKAVNATQEMISQLKVHAIWGPTNSGESLAVTPIMARAKMPNIHPCVVTALIDETKYPNAFRTSPSLGQWDDSMRAYCLNILNTKKVAILGDTTGFGSAAANFSVDAFKKDGADVVYAANIDYNQPDMMPDMLRAKNAGAEVVVVWSTSTGMDARLMNTRAALKWDVPFVGHSSMSSGDVANLIQKREYWNKVYVTGYRSCSFDINGKLPPRSQEFVDQIKGKVKLSDNLLWWVAGGVDAVNLVAKAVETTGSSSADDIMKFWNSLTRYPGYYGDYTFTPTQHNGFPTEEVVMSEASSARDGAFNLAPGYKA